MDALENDPARQAFRKAILDDPKKKGSLQVSKGALKAAKARAAERKKAAPPDVD